MADDGCAAWFNDIAHSAQGVAEVFRIIFLVTAAKQRNQFVIKINLFKGREEVIPVALRFAIVPGRNAQQEDIETFEVFFAAFSNITHFSNIFTKLFLNHFCDIFSIAGIAAEENAYDCHEKNNLLKLNEMVEAKSLQIGQS